MPIIIAFTQPGCVSCELLKIYFEARGLAFEERDISTDAAARSEMLEMVDSNTTPTVLIFSGEEVEVIVGFDPQQLDQLIVESPS